MRICQTRSTFGQMRRLTKCALHLHQTVAQSFKFYNYQTSSQNCDPVCALNTGEV